MEHQRRFLGFSSHSKKTFLIVIAARKRIILFSVQAHQAAIKK